MKNDGFDNARILKRDSESWIPPRRKRKLLFCSIP